MTDPQDTGGDAALAAEYALRLLDAEAERAVEERLGSDADLRQLVVFWEAEFAALAHEVPEVAPPAGLKRRIMAELFGPEPGWNPFRRWSWLALPGVVALALVAFLVVTPMLRGPAFDPAYHATLISADGAVHIEAGYAPDGSLFKVIPELGAPAPGRDFELWVIGADGSAPVSLGVIPADSVSLFEIDPALADLIATGSLAVSDEPAGGSPTGAPTGPILASDEFFDADLFQPG